MMNIPWRIKSNLYRVFSYLPGEALYFAQRRITKRSTRGIGEVHEAWHYHKKNIELIGAKKLVEFGAGKSLGQNIYLSTTGVEQTVVDLFPMIDLNHVNAMIEGLHKLGTGVSNTPVSNLDDLKEHYGITYRAPYDMRDTDLADDSMDICVSTNTLEHIPAKDIELIFKEVYRVIRPGGIVSAQVDYSDHYAHTDPSITLLNYLKFSEKQWERHNFSNHYQNRMRHMHHHAIYTGVGFNVLEAQALNRCEPPAEPLRPELLTGDETDFATTGRWALQK